MSKKGGAQKFVIKDNNLLVRKFIDSIKFATSIANLSSKMNPILSRDFVYQITGNLGEKTGEKRDFYRHIFSRQKIYENSDISIQKEGENVYLINYKNSSQLKINQKIFINDYKINRVIEDENIGNRMQNGGQGYSYNTSINPVAGQPVISPYYRCCRPIYFGDLLKGGGKKKTQNGGNVGTGYRFALNRPHFNVLPQYEAYSN